MKRYLPLLALATVVVLATEFTNLVTYVIGGTNTYELYDRNAYGIYNIPVTKRTRTLNVLGSPAWQEVSISYYNPPTSTPGGYVVSQMTTTYTGTRQPGTYTIAPLLSMTTTFAGANPPPTQTRQVTAIAPTGIGSTVGTATKYLIDVDGITRRNVFNIPSATFKCASPDNVPSPFWAKVTFQNEDTGEIKQSTYLVDYIGLTYTVTPPGAGLWTVDHVNFYR